MRQVHEAAGAGLADAVEAGSPGQAHKGKGVVTFRLAVQVLDDQVQGGALDFGDGLGTFGDERRLQP